MLGDVGRSVPGGNAGAAASGGGAEAGADGLRVLGLGLGCRSPSLSSEESPISTASRSYFGLRLAWRLAGATALALAPAPLLLAGTGAVGCGLTSEGSGARAGSGWETAAIGTGAKG